MDIETIVTQFYSAQIQTETKFSFCGKCLRKMFARDRPYHKCEFRRSTDETYRRMEQVLRLSRWRYLRAILYTLWALKPLLGKDPTVKIVKILMETRRDLGLWYSISQIPIKKNPTKSRLKRDLKKRCAERLDQEIDLAADWETE